jgi:hypothetical protein
MAVRDTLDALADVAGAVRQRLWRTAVNLGTPTTDKDGNVTSILYNDKHYEPVENTELNWQRIWYALLGFRLPTKNDNSNNIIVYDNSARHEFFLDGKFGYPLPENYAKRFDAFMEAMCFAMQYVSADAQVMMIALISVMPSEIYRMFYRYCLQHKSKMEWFYNIIPMGMGSPTGENTWDLMTVLEWSIYKLRQVNLRGLCSIIVKMTLDGPPVTISTFEYFQYFEGFVDIKKPREQLEPLLLSLSPYAMPALSQLCFKPGFEQVLTLINNSAWLRNSSLSANVNRKPEHTDNPQVDKPAVGSFTYNNQAGVTDGAERVLHSAKRVGNAVFYENNVLLGTLGRQEMYAVDTACSTLVVSGCGLNANTMFEPSTSAILLFMRTIVHSRFARTDGHDSRSRSKTAWFSRVLLLTS